MFEGRVVGTVVATTAVAGLEGSKFMLVEKLDGKGLVVACDQAQAGPQDHVLCVTAREASHAMPERFVPVDAAIVGIIDRVDRRSS